MKKENKFKEYCVNCKITFGAIVHVTTDNKKDAIETAKEIIKNTKIINSDIDLIEDFSNEDYDESSEDFKGYRGYYKIKIDDVIYHEGEDDDRQFS